MGGSLFLDVPKYFGLLVMYIIMLQIAENTKEFKQKLKASIRRKSDLFRNGDHFGTDKVWNTPFWKLHYLYIIHPSDISFWLVYVSSFIHTGTVGCYRFQGKILQVQIFCWNPGGDWMQKEGSSTSGYIYAIALFCIYCVFKFLHIFSVIHFYFIFLQTIKLHL